MSYVLHESEGAGESALEKLRCLSAGGAKNEQTVFSLAYIFSLKILFIELCTLYCLRK